MCERYLGILSCVVVYPAVGWLVSEYVAERNGTNLVKPIVLS